MFAKLHDRRFPTSDAMSRDFVCKHHNNNNNNHSGKKTYYIEVVNVSVDLVQRRFFRAACSLYCYLCLTFLTNTKQERARM